MSGQRLQDVWSSGILYGDMFRHWHLNPIIASTIATELHTVAATYPICICLQTEKAYYKLCIIFTVMIV